MVIVENGSINYEAFSLRTISSEYSRLHENIVELSYKSPNLLLYWNSVFLNYLKIGS
jgi:hypothetical protein